MSTLAYKVSNNILNHTPGTQPMSSPSPAPSPAAAPSPIRMQQPTNKPNLKRDHTQENGQQEQAQPKRFGFGMKVQPVSKKVNFLTPRLTLTLSMYFTISTNMEE